MKRSLTGRHAYTFTNTLFLQKAKKQLLRQVIPAAQGFPNTDKAQQPVLKRLVFSRVPACRIPSAFRQNPWTWPWQKKRRQG
ncbi:uncharacterized protein EI97DRAFT_39974 [Westerdykella ornata]|uniref:Uncharacterized protein n=1 Tax=Westerdykella ornata TaxID=318751 RepID=A0A6A6JJZ5_WESOR|nr:uncharacterized protein EI97DRAFT_39974 [Westerdykella ornata]KAF2276443.1 hypothetical protein EI97DRAFT_39974 [Westerdykella ornata]